MRSHDSGFVEQRPVALCAGRISEVKPPAARLDRSATSLPVDQESLLSRARACLGAGRLGAARPLVEAARRLGPASPELGELDARLLAAEGRIVDALVVLDTLIAAAPQSPAARALRAEYRLAQSDWAGAALDASELVCSRSGGASAKAILGAALGALGRGEEAVACLREALDAEPDRTGWREALAEELQRLERRADAAQLLSEGIARSPGAVGLRAAAVLAATRRRDYEAAVSLAETAVLDGVADARVYGLLGHAMSCLGRHDTAAQAYAEALKLAPGDPYVRHLVSASGAVPSAPRASPDYVAAVFDGYAPRFEDHLIALGYRVPGLIRAALLRWRPTLESECRPLLPPIVAETGTLEAASGCRPLFGPVLDLGCGTGFVGVALSDLPVGPLLGIDLSERMIERAAEKGLYASLRRIDVEAALESETSTFEGVIAADVLCYFGDLSTVLKGVGKVLRPGGLFLFSVETLPEVETAAWRLRANGRYAHRRACIDALAVGCGLTTLEVSPTILRWEANEPVDGLIYVLRRDPQAASGQSDSA